MNDDNREAEFLINQRFASAIRIAVSHTLKALESESDYHLRKDLNQEAGILVLHYAGIMGGWQSGKLDEWTDVANGDETQIQLLVINQLKMALAQIVERSRTGPASSLYVIMDHGLEPIDTGQEDRIIDHIDRQQEVTEMHLLYPTLARNVLDGLTQAEIAEEDGIGHATVERKIAKEKRAFLTRVIQRHGVKVTGEEDLDELVEAYGYLTESQPSEKVRSNNPVKTGHRPIPGNSWNHEWCMDCRSECDALSEREEKVCPCCFKLSGEDKEKHKMGKRQENNDAVNAALQLISNNER